MRRFLEFLASSLFDVIALSFVRARNGNSKVVLVHIELLGDYVLWLPFARAMLNHFIAQGRSVSVVVNSVVEPLARKHLHEAECICVDRRLFSRDWRYRWFKLRCLRGLGASWVIHDSAPRDGVCSDATVRALGAQKCWGFSQEFFDRPWVDRVFGRRLYSHLLQSLEGDNRFNLHRAMAVELGVRDEDIQPIANFSEGFSCSAPQGCLVVAPGASDAQRRWPAERFASAARGVLDRGFVGQCIVVGSSGERELCEAVAAKIGPQASSFAGKTTIQELIGLIAHARLVMGNDSAVCHIAAACGVPSLVIVGGGQFGCCFPYEGNSPVCVKPSSVSRWMPCFGCRWQCRWPVSSGEAYPCLMGISNEEVQSLLSEMTVYVS